MVNNTADEHISQLSGLLYQSGISYGAVIVSLQKLTAIMRSFDTRCDLSFNHWKPIEILAKECGQFFKKNEIAGNELNLLIELLRFLRNSCGGLNGNLDYVLGHDDLLSIAKESLRYFIQKESPNEIVALKIAIQLFGNILASSEYAKPLIWSLFFGENIFRHLFQHKDVTIRECAMMVLFNSMSDENCECIFNSPEGREIIFFVSDTLLFSQIDWGVLFIEHLLNRPDFLDCCYSSLPLKHRLLILDIMEERLKSTQGDQNFLIPGALILYIKNIFLKNITHISEIKESDIEPAETVSMLSILCTASICEAYISILQNSTDLVQTTVEVLKCIHLMGKEGCSVFSILSDTKHLNDQAREEIAGHPLYCFKKNLIRLIGNLCCSCKDNQDLVRKLDGIPLILDCSKFDAKNPYITQWCVLAIRNMLENNLESQAIVANISASGKIADPKLLSEMGIQIHSENGKIHMTS
ncbi:ataxin-10 [Nephila pilipes]|uniref:Ataxin-10 n=1 Tax=Nephila pilipes TaxID=299642 RepID=A0A8X6QZX4_NEPPI|nr:ataxin-10 [Nephila pilipes]